MITDPQDLYRWWFLRKCSQNKMSVVSRSWAEVVADPRYKAAVAAGLL